MWTLIVSPGFISSVSLFGVSVAIVATCGIEQIPREWAEQLAEGGRLVAPVGEPKCQKLTLFRKLGGELIPERIGAYSRFQMLRQKPPQVEIKPRYSVRGDNQ